MGQARCDIIGGPCIVETAAATYISEGDVTVEARPSFRDIVQSLHGKIGQRKTDQRISVKFVPLGFPSYAPTLFALNVGDIGSDILGCADAFLRIKGKDGTTVEFKAAGIMRPPPIRFAPNKSLYGEVEFACAVADGADLTTAGSVKTITTGNPFTDPEEACDLASIIERAATAAWGTVAPFDSISMTEDGVEVSIEYETEPKLTARNGTIGYRLMGIVAKATLRPSNIDEGEFFTMLPVDGATAAIGELPEKRLLTLTSDPAAGGLTVKLQNAFVDDSGGSLVWGQNENRIGGVTLRASVDCETDPVTFVVSLVPPYSVDVNP